VSTTLDVRPSRLPSGPAGDDPAGDDPVASSTPFASRLPGLLAVLVVLVGIVLAPPRGPVLGAGEVLLRSGPLEASTDGTWRDVAVGERLGPGAMLRAGGGEVVLDVAGGSVRLAPGTTLTLGRDEDVLTAGAMLLEVDRLRQLRVGAVTAAGTGAWRVETAPTPRVAVYRGGAGVVGTREVALGPLSQSVLNGSDVSAEAPLTYLASDPWDVRLAAEPLAVDRQVAALSSSLAALYGDQPQTVGFYGDFVAVDDGLLTALPELSPRVDGARFGPPAPVLVGVVTVRLLVERAALSPVDAATEVLETRRAGGTWGVVVVRRDLGADDLRATADAALRRRAQDQADGVAAPLIGPGGPPSVPGTDPPVVSQPPAQAPKTRDEDDAPDDRDPTPPSPGPGDDGDDGDTGDGPVGDTIETVRGVRTGIDPVDTTLDELLDPVEDVGRSIDELLLPSQQGSERSSGGLLDGGLLGD
jgi:hypothetical protein